MSIDKINNLMSACLRCCSLIIHILHDINKLNRDTRMASMIQDVERLSSDIQKLMVKDEPTIYPLEGDRWRLTKDE